MHHRRIHRLAIVDVGCLHPLRIALFTPVDKRCLTSDKARLCVVDHLEIIFKRVTNHRVDKFQPLLVAGHLIDFVGSNSPNHTVGANRPCTTRAGVLNYTAVGIHLLHQRNLRCLRLHVGHRENDGVAHIACPDACPLLTGAKRGVGLNGVDHLVKSHIENSCVQSVGCCQAWIHTDIVLQFPHMLHRHKIVRLSVIRRHNFGRRWCMSDIFALNYRVTPPDISVCLDNFLCLHRHAYRGQRQHSD